LHCQDMMTFTELASVPSDPMAPFTDQLRLAVAAYLARFKGSSRDHTESDLRCYLTWCAERGLDPLAAKRPHLELYIRWMQEIRRFKPSTVSRRFSVTAGFYRTCVLDGVLPHSPGFVQGRLRRGGRAVRAAVAALRRDAPADQGHAPAGNCGQRWRAGREPAPAAVAKPRDPVWIGSWGSRAGMRRVARAGDGWLASAYNTTPEAFTAAMEVLGGELESQQRPSGDFPNALVTMWAWITGSRSEADRVLSDIIAPLVR
jgi:hypothetical protein